MANPLDEQKTKEIAEDNEDERGEPDYGDLLESPKPVGTGSDAGVPEFKVGEPSDKPTTKEIVDNAKKAIEDIESGRNIDVLQVQTMCDPNMRRQMELHWEAIRKLDENFREQERREFTELVNRSNKAMEQSLSNAEQVGGTPLMSELIERTNSNAWLDASPLRLRHVENGEGDENVVELFDSVTNRVIHSLRFPKADSRRTKK